MFASVEILKVSNKNSSWYINLVYNLPFFLRFYSIKKRKFQDKIFEKEEIDPEIFLHVKCSFFIISDRNKEVEFYINSVYFRIKIYYYKRL